MRQTEEAYRKGLIQGFALAKAQYEELLRDNQSALNTEDQSKNSSEEP